MNFFSRKVRDWKNNSEIKRRRALHSEMVADVSADYKKKLAEVSPEAVMWALAHKGPMAFDEMPRPKFSLMPYTPPFDGIATPDAILAMDDIAPAGIYKQEGRGTGMFRAGGFPGFPYLVELTQINEYRDITDPTANEMTRKFIEFHSTGETKRDKQIAKLKEAFERYHVKEWMNWLKKFGGYMGRAQLFLDFEDDEKELELPLLITPKKIKKGAFKRIKGIEPITTYPAEYDASNPLAQDYYTPSAWWVYSARVHASRLLTITPNPLPDLLKPVFNFSGVSHSQLAQPYVDYFLQGRDSAGRLLRNFATGVFKTDMSQALAGGNMELFQRRMMFFTALQRNEGVFMLDNNEDFSKENTPLGGVKELLSQAQEHMATVAKTPLSVMFGLSPSGLTTTAESDITIFNNHINSAQEAELRGPVTVIMKVIMCSEFGKIYDDITFNFVDLVSLNGKEKSQIRTADGATDVAYVTAGVLSAQEVRGKVAADPESGYNGLDVDKPSGKLQEPAPGGGESESGGGSAPSSSGEKKDSEAENAPDLNEEDEASGESKDSKAPLMKEAADMMIEDAHRIAQDSGLWGGNQHTGGMGGKDEDPTHTAMKHTVVAQKATKTAYRTGRRSDHKTALAAHQRAMEAHTSAAEVSTGLRRHVHDSYVAAHEAAIAAHKMESAPQPEEVEA